MLILAIACVLLLIFLVGKLVIDHIKEAKLTELFTTEGGVRHCNKCSNRQILFQGYKKKEWNSINPNPNCECSTHIG